MSPQEMCIPGLEHAVLELMERTNSASGTAAAHEAVAHVEDEIFETFDDLVAEATAEEVLHDVKPGPPTAQDSADSLQAAEAWIEAEPLADDSEPATGGKPRKRKKKISFV